MSEQSPAIRKGRYRHFKGNCYELIDTARHSETGEWLVIYRPLYGEGGLWVRPLAMFDDWVERDGVSVQRFEFIGEGAQGATQ
ncbi:DUF1653 domain-containing protein [Porticoccus sp.]